MRDVYGLRFFRRVTYYVSLSGKRPSGTRWGRMAMLVQELRTDVVAPTERWDLWQDFATRTHAPTLQRSDHSDDFRAPSG